MLMLMFCRSVNLAEQLRSNNILFQYMYNSVSTIKFRYRFSDGLNRWPRTDIQRLRFVSVIGFHGMNTIDVHIRRQWKFSNRMDIQMMHPYSVVVRSFQLKTTVFAGPRYQDTGVQGPALCRDQEIEVLRTEHSTP
ncbi:hypothetical protein Mapa_009143 [Marchantia paleacea]|nr:hypothetical protein Mapa_009143 [Marchantia paleacea]